MKLITDKQKKTMKKLGLIYDEGMSNKEAFDLIREELETRAAAEDMEYNPFIDDVPLFDKSNGYYTQYED